MPETDKVAVIGFSFRLPGLTRQDPGGFWQALLSGADLVGEVDPGRWEKDTFLHPERSNPGTSYTFSAGSIGDVAGFDAAFFGISPREAAQMDPQQRLLLELSWEALENAGVKPSSLRRGRCGVYVGISSTDYAYRRADDLASLDASSMTGNSASIAANRISYAFDLRGPSMAVDTACSSSLVAFHQACRAISSGEAEQALVGGVSLHLHPYGFVGFSKASMLSRRGICNVFDAAGDGYVRSEGAAIFVLKRYEQAVADGDDIIAIVAGSGTNCDGKTNGITVPGCETQTALIEEVYAGAGIDPDDVDYLEAHGTGTAVGDPIETRAIGAALGSKRRHGPLPIGSVKSNLGHLEAASACAGLVKALLCLRERAIPPTIHLTNPNPAIRFADWNLDPVTAIRRLPDGKALVIGINSFGFGGANAHVVLRSPSAAAAHDTVTPAEPRHLQLSARDDAALRASAASHACWLRDRPDVSVAQLAAKLAASRDLLELRLVVDVSERADLIRRLDEYAATGAAAGLSAADAVPDAGKPVFVYSGNGSQWVGMGRELLLTRARFRAAVEEVDRLFARHEAGSIVAWLEGMTEEQLALTEIAQPTLFALQVGLTTLLRDGGIEPAAVIGHSVGEVAAGWASGALTLEQAVQVIHCRSREQGRTRGQGMMTAATLEECAANDLIRDLALESRVCVAGINSPKGITLAGEAAGLDTIEAALRARGVPHKRLDLDYAFHSAAMDPIAAGIQTTLAALRPVQGMVPFYSAVVGGKIDGCGLDAVYWWRNIREPVRFAAAVDCAIEAGARLFVEIGPHPVLGGYLRDLLHAAPSGGRTIRTLSRTDAGGERVDATVREIIASGADVARPVATPLRAGFAELPTYPWQKEAMWHPVTTESGRHLQRRKEHPLLGYRLAENAWQWQNQIDLVLQPNYRDHVVGNAVVMPASGFIEMALAAASLWQPERNPRLENLEIHAPLLLDEKHAKMVRFTIDTSDGSFRITSNDRLSGDLWLTNVSGRLLGGEPRESSPGPRQRRAEPRSVVIDAAAHYRAAAAIGLDYGPAFRAVDQVTMAGDRIGARIIAPECIAEEISRHHLHPSLLDGCFQLLVNLLQEGGKADACHVPVRMGEVRLFQAGRPVHSCEVTVVRHGPHSLVADCELFAADGSRIATIRDARFRRIVLKRRQADLLRQLASVAVPKAGPSAASGTALAQPFSALLDQAMAETPMSAGLVTYHEEVEPLLDIMCGAYLSEGLKKLAGAGMAFVADQLVARGLVDADRLSVLDDILALLHDDGLVRKGGQGWQWIDGDSLPDARTTWRTLLEDYPDYAGRIVAMSLVGENLDRILRGDSLPADLVPDLARMGGFSAYTGETDYRMFAIMRKALTMATRNLKPGGRLRILELSMQASRFAPMVLDHLDRGACDYVLGIADESFRDANHLLADAFPGLEHVAWSPASPGLDAERTFDLILLPDGLLDVEDKVQFLSTLRGHLVAGGELVLLAQTPSRWSSLLQLGRKPTVRYQIPFAWNASFSAAGYGGVAIREDNAKSGIGAVLYSARNEDAATAPAPTRHGCWALLVPDGHSVAAAHLLAGLGRRLSEQGHVLATIHLPSACGQASAAATRSLRDQLSALATTNGDITGIVLAAAAAARTSDEDMTLDMHLGAAEDALAAMRAQQAFDPAPELVLLTAGVHGQLVGKPCNPQDACLWGLGRAMINESTGGRVRLVDLAGDLSRIDGAAVADELLDPDGEDEVILTTDGRHVLRIRDQGRLGHEHLPDRRSRVRLDFAQPGQLKNLRWIAEASRLPGPGEVAIEVRAAGLNFRDVMFTMGLLSDEAVEQGFAGPTLGMELSGVILAVGPGVAHLLPGMEVIAFAPSAFSSQVITPANAVVKKPAHWSFEAAATIPTAFFTAYYALHHLARLQPGETVLIHGAAGGVGIAAIRLAQYLGAEIFATAGSEEKRQFVRQLGVEHVLDSRSLEYADRILEITGGKGIDVVLNSLSGEAINQNLRILRPFGRFLELGKRDFYENTRVGLRPFRNNISYFGIDADQLMSQYPDLTERLLAELMALFESDQLKPLPYRGFAATKAVEAFRYMQQSRQIGKIVLSFRDGLPIPDRWPEAGAAPRMRVTADGSYLVSGGLRGFGLATARHLVERGARHLVLVARGEPGEDARQALADFARAGVEAHAIRCDVSCRDEVEALFARIARELPPLRGIVHAAAVIDDGLLRNLGHDQLARVFAPKVSGADHLDRCSRDCDLDFFLLYSSATTLFGNPGQGGYVAANAYLEALAARRRQRGLPALAIRWGAIADTGFLARNAEIGEALRTRMGGEPLETATALAALDALLAQDQPAVALLEFDWNVLSRHLPGANAPKYAELAGHDDRADNPEASADLQRWLRELPPDELQAAMLDLLKAEIGEILRLAPEKIDADKSLYDMGMDSLMAVELLAAVDQRFGISLPVMALSEGPTLTRLAQRIVHQINGGAEPESADQPGLDQVITLAQRHGGDVETATIDRIAENIGRE